MTLSQLRLLLWKNYTIRKRNKMRCLAEIAWPGCLFLLLTLVRSKGFQSTVHQCFFEETALPSSGSVTFYQSMLCTLNNTCLKYPKTSTGIGHPLLISALERIYEVNSDPEPIMNLESIYEFGQILFKMKLNNTDFDNTLVKLAVTAKKEMDEIDSFVTSLEMIENISTLSSGGNLRDSMRNSPVVRDVIKNVHDLVCGNNSDIDVDVLLGNKKSSFDPYLDTLVAKEETEHPGQLLSSNCNKLFQDIESSFGLTWAIIKPFIRGKIVYSPDTPLIRRIIDKIKINLWPPNLHIMEFQDHLLSIYPNFTSSYESLSKFLKNVQVDESETLINISDFLSQPILNITINRILSTFARFNNTVHKIRGIRWNNLNISSILKCYTDLGRFEGYPNEEKASERAWQLCDNNALLAQLSFVNADKEYFNSTVTYKIRMNTNRLPAEDILKSGGTKSYPLNNLNLMSLGFIYLQDIVERSIITEITGRQDLPTISLNQLPHPCFIYDWFLQSIMKLFPLFMILSWVHISSMIVKNIVFEKEQRLKEVMRILGLSNSLIWLGWFIDSLFFLIIACCLLSLILVYGGILGHASVTLIFFYLIIFSIATISLSFLISVFFSKANLAASSGGLIFFILYLPFIVLESWPNYFTYKIEMLMCLISNLAFALGSKLIAKMELEGTGASWSNITEASGNTVSLLTIILILLFDSFTYCVVAWYIENIYPGDFGVPKKWYFLGTKDYWFRGKFDALKGDKDSYFSNDTVEAEPHHLPRGVVVRDLTKIYDNGKVAVANLSINFYENQITAFLGKNGAGKSTTLSILTGLISPTSGTAYIYGLDIRTDMSTIRKQLGICPQHNILYLKLTVEEQLWFYARLRGHTPGEAQIEVRQSLSDLGLESQSNTLTYQLSGGMQRKLCIGIAFIGKSKTIILDEPTAGVDPFSRTAIWNLLLKYKQGRTIIMTSHSMVEAETLSDRIAIFSSGYILGYGSISFLRERFGRGYCLTVDRGMHYQDNEALNTAVLTEAFKTKMKDVELIEEYGSELKFSLPQLTKNIENYNELFLYLSKNKEVLGIQSVGLSDSNLEEIFFRLVNEAELGTYDVQPPDEKTDFPPCEENPWKLMFKRFHALSYKRFLHFKRSKILFFCETLFPALFIALTLSLTNSTPRINQPLSRVIDPLDCKDCVLFYQVKETSKWITKYVDEINLLNGLSCQAKNGSIKTNCKRSGVYNVSEVVYSEACSCSSGRLSCSKPTSYIEMPYFNLSNENMMLDATNTSISEWILNTWHSFINSRTGGFTFGTKNSLAGTLFNDSSTWKTAVIPGNKVVDFIKIWIGSKWLFSPVAYLNMINNAILRASVKDISNDSYSIQLLYHPMNYTENQYKFIIASSSTGLLHSVAVVLILGFVPASYLLYVVEERVNDSKHIQYLSGVSATLYWTHAFLWDLVFFTFTSLMCILMYIAFSEEAFVANGNYIYLFLLFFLYGWACIPLMYLGSFLFSVPSSAFVTLSSFNIFVGIATSASMYILKLFDDEVLLTVESIFREIFLIFPHFCLGKGMIEMVEIYLVSTTVETYGSMIEVDMISWSYLGSSYASMIAVGTLGFIMVLLVENCRGKKICREHLRTIQELSKGEEDVEAEKERVLSGRDNDILVLKYLCKRFGEKTIGVNQLSLGVRKGECFGLLGTNGAGKSTTFNMLTGKTSITFGDALIDGKSVRYSINKIKTMIGYCPQYDALDPLLTPREHLKFYSMLRGVPKTNINDVVEQALNCFDLAKSSDVTSKRLSGGYKRKLSTAISLLGNPPLVFMDEPTSSLDVKGRRFLWQRLKYRVRNGATIVLTSHILPECEALCSRLTIMVRGRFTCLGSVQHLKNKYGKGYTLIVRALFGQLDAVRQVILRELPDIIEICCYSEQIKYRLNLTFTDLIEVFRILDKLKTDNCIHSYSVSQNSLEQVFLHFVNNQVVSEEEVQKSSSCQKCILL